MAEHHTVAVEVGVAQTEHVMVGVACSEHHMERTLAAELALIVVGVARQEAGVGVA